MIRHQHKYLLTCLLFFSSFFTVSAQPFNGRLEWVHKVEMRVLADGVINHVYVKAGQNVKKGSVLLSMDQRKAKARRLKAKALIARATVNLSDANDELNRLLELYDRGLIAEEELKKSKATHAAALAEKESAQASLALAEVDLERTTLRAPISGIVVAMNAYEGGIVYKTLQKRPLVSIAPHSKMLARVLANATILNRYRVGQTARINNHGKNYTGKIYSLGVEPVRIDPNGAVYELDIIFNHNPREVLRPSDVVKVSLP